MVITCYQKISINVAFEYYFFCVFAATLPPASQTSFKYWHFGVVAANEKVAANAKNAQKSKKNMR